ncbi:MAG: NAD+ synthase, partial [Gammaproteobacteria bacterium]|nr:NAD+ synthase [Gammaproteobacteria bacterium]
MKKLRIVMAQLNMLVGDIEGNAAKVIAAAERARDDFSADAIVFPELTLTGYPPEDLLLRPGLYTRVLAALEQINLKVRDIDIILGHPHAAAGGLYNAASLLRADTAEATYHKQHLPNYSVFDEKRYFAVGSEPCVVEIKGVPVGLTVCEDIWQPGSVAQAVDAGARLIVNINASPFHIDKGRERERAVRERVTEGRVPVLYVNLVGGQDELVFDGGSFVMDREGNITQQSPAFEEGLYPVEFAVAGGEVTPQPGLCAAPLSEEASVYNALVLGVRDYVEKNGFPGVVIG